MHKYLQGMGKCLENLFLIDAAGYICGDAERVKSEIMQTKAFYENYHPLFMILNLTTKLTGVSEATLF